MIFVLKKMIEYHAVLKDGTGDLKIEFLTNKKINSKKEMGYLIIAIVVFAAFILSEVNH